MRIRQGLTTRGGRKVPLHLYWQRGPQPADDDPAIGIVFTPELAEWIVACTNAMPPGTFALQDAALMSMIRLEKARNDDSDSGPGTPGADGPASG